MGWLIACLAVGAIVEIALLAHIITRFRRADDPAALPPSAFVEIIGAGLLLAALFGAAILAPLIMNAA